MKRKFFNHLQEKKVAAFKRYVNAHPKKVMAYIFLIVGCNFILLLYLNKQSKSAYSITDIYTGKIVRDNLPQKRVENSVSFSISNLYKMKTIKDSLEYFMSKEHKCKDDTLLLLRLFKKYEELDTSFNVSEILSEEYSHGISPNEK